MLRLGVISQKGGVGKSTIAQIIAVEFARAEWRVKIADMDVFQKTSTDWVADRRRLGVTPDVQCEPFATLAQVVAQDVDLLVFDGKPSSDRETREIARRSDGLIIPVRGSKFDLRPQLKLAVELQHAGIETRRILFAVNCVNTEAEARDTMSVIGQSGFACSKHPLYAKALYGAAQNAGRALSETQHPALRKQAEGLAGEVSSFIEELANVQSRQAV